jgi:cytochrome c-550 PedF
MITFARAPLVGIFVLATSLTVMAAGLPLTIEPVNTEGLPEVPEEWLTENPYRAEKAGPEVWQKAVDIGSSGFNQNCARCHGLGAVSGGLAPDLRFLEASEFGDEWYVERFIHGYTQDGTTKMPAFGEILGQKAAWAIRTYIETRPEDGSMDEHAERLKAIRDELVASSGDPVALKEELTRISGEITTASGAPVADSIAYRAALALDGSDAQSKHASDVLTVGLSAAK